MEIQDNSRFITYPSTVEKSNNHTVILIDADVIDIENIGLFLKTSVQNFDVYLYKGDLDDLEWLSHISQSADHILINDSSQVAVTDATRVGKNQQLTNPLDYFIRIDDNLVD